MNVITRRQDPAIKTLCAIRDDRAASAIFIEGPRLLREALQASLPLQTLVICQSRCSKALAEDVQLVEAARRRAKQTLWVNESVFRLLSDVEEPQGIAAICGKPQWTWADVIRRKPALVLILDRLQNPGNMASILRTAEASGAAGIITTKETAHLFSPKALRGAMGSAFRLPVLEHQPAEDIVRELSASGYGLIETASGKQTVYTDLDWSKPWAIVLGQEGGGVSSAWTGHLQKSISIPMSPPVDSLNVAAAAAILLYESSRNLKAPK